VAQEQDVTVMFCDIVSFTTLCEDMQPHDVALLLNNFLGRMAEEIFELEGTLDKFIGDAILAVFGAPFPQPDQADRAVQCAINMRRRLAEMNEQQGSRPLRMRIAINTGPALTGDIGSHRRREFTVLGDVVNTASRIQRSLTQPDQIVISAATLKRLTRPVGTRPLGVFQLHGRHADTQVFEVS
jgi:adenylate cyclase